MSYKEAIKREFPLAMPGPVFTRKIIDLFAKRGFTPENTVFANSTCPDEINRKVTQFADHYGENFTMGGLAGFPFTGITGLNAFSHHVPDNGNLFILYGPHIGVSNSGELAKIKRQGMSKESTSCGSLCGAYAFLKEKWDTNEPVQLSYDQLDPQQWYVTKRLHACRNAIEWSDNPIRTVVEAAFGSIDEEIQAIFADDRTHYSGNIALIGGIQINTPVGEEDYFLPKRIEYFEIEGRNKTNLMKELFDLQNTE